MAAEAGPGQFGELLRRHRLAAGLSQESLAERAALSRRGISDLERGERRAPHPGTAARLAEALGLADTERVVLLHAATSVGKGSSVDAGVPNNLPLQLTSFVGRVRDTDVFARELAGTRLLTLTGPGGVGKTRLALEVATGILNRSDAYPDGVWFVDLAPLADGALIPRAFGSALGIQELPEQPLLETLRLWLRPRCLLLVLDNCEQVIEACASMADQLLHACPHLTILATSREALNVAGEVVRRVGPLPADSDRLQLFADRAAASSLSFDVTPHNKRAVLRICQQLDGLPLAIELAAARVTTFTVEEIEQRLDQRFTLLTTGRRGGPARHRTLRGLIDWSYELLAPGERRLLQQVSVFAGGWTLEAAEAVCESAVGVQEALSSLVDKSLVQVEQRTGRSRYRLLETLREYAGDRLREARAEREARSRHLNWCARFSRALEQQALGPCREAAVQRLDTEIDNIRAGLTWALQEPACVDTGLQLAASVARFGFVYGAEASEWLNQLLGRTAAGPARAEGLSAAGFLLMRLGDPRAALAPAEEAVVQARCIADRGLLVFSLLSLGALRLGQHDVPGARASLEEALALTRDGASPPYLPEYRLPYHLGQLAEVENDADTATSFYAQSLQLAQAQGDDEFCNVIQRGLGSVALSVHDVVAARAYLFDALLAARKIGKESWNIPQTLMLLACVANAEAQPERALRLAAAASGLRERQQAGWWPSATARLEAVIESATAALGQAAAARAWAAGHALTAGQAVAYAMEGASSRATPPTSSVLTPRELEVAALLEHHATNREIAARLVISERTAKRHVENILLKLGLRSRMQVAAWAREWSGAAADSPPRVAD